MTTMLDPTRAMKSLEDGTISAIQAYFPLEGREHTLVATKVYAGQDVDIDDIASQKKARMRNRTWSTNLYGDFTLKDKKTGKILDEAKGVKIAAVPKLTRRYSFIVDGKEYQVDNQWRLKSGVYARKRQNGELESMFNLSKGRGFRMDFYPPKRQFLLRYGTTNVQLLPVLRAMGAEENDLRAAWGNQLYDSVAAQKPRGDLQKLAKALDSKFVGKTDEEATETIRAQYAQTALSADITEITLGEKHSVVDKRSLLAASSKLLGVSRGTHEEDNRDSLRFKELWTAQDLVPERITNSRRRILGKLRNNADRKDKVRDIISPDIFGVPLKAFFTATSLSQQPSQLNPVDMLGTYLRTTLLGQGAITTDRAITLDAKSIDPSSMGFLDPAHTSEGARSGVALHLSLGVGLRGKEPTTAVWDVKANKKVLRTPSELALGNVGFADQFEEKDGKYQSRQPMATVLPKGGGDPSVVKASEVDYVLVSTKQMFSIASSLVPFLPSDQATRIGMATRHMEQSITLKYREAPLVQVVSGSKEAKADTWEKLVGKAFSHSAPVSGTVVTVAKDKIVIQGEDKQLHTLSLYDNYPLNEKKAFVNSEPLVAVGDKVKEGDTVADTSHTRDGVLALGTNLRVAFLPFRGLTFEDGIVISESTAKKLTSEHLHKPRVYLDRGMSVGLNKFRANFPGVVSEKNAKKLDADGVIKVGQRIEAGDVLATVLRKNEPSPEQVMLKGIHKALARPYRDQSIVWDHGYAGVVTDVARNGSEIAVHVRTEEPAEVADKLSARHGNKGVISAILPDEEMPKDTEGHPMDIIVNPAGVPSRINLGQVLETSMGKVAHKEGKTFAVDNFQTDTKLRIVEVRGHYRTVQTDAGPKEVWVHPHTREMGYQELVQEALKQHNVTDTEELIDPATGKSFGQVLTGYQYFIKLQHQVDKKLAARGYGHGNPYDQDMAPKGGGDSGSQRFGELGLYAMLAHGATANVRDALTYKSDKTQSDVWIALQTGEPLPAPKPSFAYNKFLATLRGVGVDVEKNGNELRMLPFTEAQIKRISGGALSDASKVFRGKDLKPEEGGLFDEKITGGPGGKNWSHIALSEKVPNPVFERSILALLGLTGNQYDAIVSGQANIDGKTGPSAIVDALGKLDVDKELPEAEAKLKTARRTELDKLNKRVKYLRALKHAGVSAQDAYSFGVVPVLPPMYRPIAVMEGGDLNIDGINLLYRDLALIDQKLREGKGKLPDETLLPLRKELYKAVEAITGVDGKQTGLTVDGDPKPVGLLTILSGRTSPKESFVHSKLMDRKQDLSMRSVITPDPTLSLDELALPRKGAMEIFKPFVVRELVHSGFTPLQAREEIDKGSPLAQKALDVAVSKRPVLFKRDPVLHKFGVMAFMAKLHDGKEIKTNPLITGPFNADYDGDQMSVFVPITQQAVDEAYRMLPSKNMFSAATGDAMYQPSLEGQLGLYLLTHFGKDSGKKFATMKEALDAAKHGDLQMSDVVTAEGKRTTPGRIAFYAALPESVREDSMLTDPERVMGKKNLQHVMLATAHKAPAQYRETLDKFKELGWGYVHDTGFSFSMSDFSALHEIRDKVLDKTKGKALAIGRSDISQAQKDKQLISLYTEATAEVNTNAKAYLDKSGNKLYLMAKAGSKPSWSQIQQMILAPMLLTNESGRTISAPVTKSYSEGLDSAGYWVASFGARKGVIDKVQSVQKPGTLTKQLVNTLVSYSVTEDDCGTPRGVALDIADTDLPDRYLAKDVQMGKDSVAAGTLLTTGLLDRMRQHKVTKVVARSALKCQSAQGLCAKCVGAQADGQPMGLGTNVGVVAGQAFGERGTQLALKSFHLGGLAGTSSHVTNSLDRTNELLRMPEVLPNKATLVDVSGVVQKIGKSPVGGWDVLVSGQEHYVPHDRELQVKVGDKLERGDPLSGGSIDPRELLERTNIDTVQRYMTDTLSSVYASEGVKKRQAEVVIKSLTNLGYVTDAGDSDELLRGDVVQLNYVHALNKAKAYQAPIVVEPMLRGLETLPLDASTDFMARLEYRRLKETLSRGASEGWKSDIHGMSPIPGVLYSAEFGKKDSNSKSPY